MLSSAFGWSIRARRHVRGELVVGNSELEYISIFSFLLSKFVSSI